MGQPAYRMSKDLWDNSLLEKQPTSESGVGLGLQDPRGKVKAKLPELQFSEGDSPRPWVDRLDNPMSPCAKATQLLADNSASNEAQPRTVSVHQQDGIRGRTEHLNHAITCIHDRSRDRLRGASPKVTELPYYSASYESSLQGEGKQVSVDVWAQGGKRDARC
jgi:hypothetical protein